MIPTSSNTQQPIIQPRKNPNSTPLGTGVNKEKVITYTYLVFSFLTISIFGIFALLPAFSTISTLNKQYEDNKKIADALETKLNALANLTREYKLLEKDLPYIYGAVPSSSQIPTFMRQVETIAQDNNVNIQSLTSGTVEFFPLENNANDLYSYTFSLEAVGAEKNINSFINTIISFNRVISIDRITTGNISGNVYKTSIGGKVYFSKDITN